MVVTLGGPQNAGQQSGNFLSIKKRPHCPHYSFCLTIWQLFVNDKTTFSSLQFLLRHFSLTSLCFPFLLGSLCKRYCYSHSNDNGISWGPYTFNHVIECVHYQRNVQLIINKCNMVLKKKIGPWGRYCPKRLLWKDIKRILLFMNMNIRKPTRKKSFYVAGRERSWMQELISVVQEVLLLWLSWLT